MTSQQLGIIIDNIDYPNHTKEGLNLKTIQLNTIRSIANCLLEKNTLANFTIIPTSTNQKKIQLFESTDNNQKLTVSEYLNQLEFCKNRNLLSSIELAIRKLNNGKLVDEFEESLTEFKNSDTDTNNSQHKSCVTSDSDLTSTNQLQNPNESENMDSSKSNNKLTKEYVNKNGNEDLNDNEEDNDTKNDNEQEKGNVNPNCNQNRTFIQKEEILHQNLFDCDLKLNLQKRIVIFLTSELNLNPTQIKRVSNLIKKTNTHFDFIYLKSALDHKINCEERSFTHKNVKKHIIEIDSKDNIQKITHIPDLFNISKKKTILPEKGENEKKEKKTGDGKEKETKKETKWQKEQLFSEEGAGSSTETTQEQTKNNNEIEENEKRNEVLVKELENIEDEMIRTAMLLSMSEVNHNQSENDNPNENLKESKNEKDKENENIEEEREKEEENVENLTDNTIPDVQTQSEFIDNEENTEIRFRLEDFDFSLLNPKKKLKKKRKSSGRKKKIDYNMLSEEEQLKLVFEMSLNQLNGFEQSLVVPDPEKKIDPEISKLYQDKEFIENLIFQLPGVDSKYVEILSNINEENSIINNEK
ncbi:hypothetical protein M0812_26273 [Anaeramoeba flamelloides]|uniref:Uncharacterized protein n=1 Tax=Anaeramoeba flamelloides TaxID=1746091 RepID=A0AAV7YDS0_9EUKA|nr:hypothetical protein M0812_26273 [Anaeramoeba flamelloides]